VIAMVDTNCDPTNVDYLIPSNDDAIRAIKLIVALMADAVLEGKAMRKEEEEEKLEPIAEGELRERVRGRIQMEEDVDEEELLGAATLQKLAESRQEAEEEMEEVEEAEETEEVGEVEEVEKAEGKTAEEAPEVDEVEKEEDLEEEIPNEDEE